MNQNWSNQGGWGHDAKHGNTQNQGFQQQSEKLSPPFNPEQDLTIISALNKNLVLDVSQNYDTMNKLMLWKRHGMNGQRFRIIEKDGKYMLMNFYGGAVSVLNNSSKDEADIIVNKPSYTPQEVWQIFPSKKEKGAYEIRSFCGKHLDVNGENDSAGTKIIQYKSTGGKNQAWYFEAI